MTDPVISPALIEVLREGGEALDRSERGPAPELALVRDAGLLTAPVPVESGGQGWGTSAAGADAICTLLMALGGASLPIARLCEGHVNAIALVARHGTAAQRANMFEAVRKGAMLGVWGADSERPVIVEHGSSGAMLSGTKAFASGLGDLGMAIVTAQENGGLHMIMVATDDPARADHAAWDVDGMVGSRSGRFDCTGLSAAPEHRLPP